MKKPNMLITKINHTEQPVEWEILRETYKQSNSIEVMDKYYKDFSSLMEHFLPWNPYNPANTP